MDARATRICDILHEAGLDWALLTSPGAVAYATGHAVPIETGPSPFAGGPTAALITREGEIALVCASHDAHIPSRAETLFTYQGFGWEKPADYAAGYLDALQRAMTGLRVCGRSGVERADLPLAVAEVIGTPLVDFTALLMRARAVKTPEELASMVRAGKVASAGQEAVRLAARAGQTELEAFGTARTAMETAAGARLAVAGDFLTGQARSANVAGWPGDRRIAPGDPVISDLAPRVGGYWADSCSAFIVGRPRSEAYVRRWQAVHEVLVEVPNLLRPGRRACDVDSDLRAALAVSGLSYPHHSGHSLGTTVHEFPRLVPWETALIETDMIIMVEPGAYDATHGGIRLERMFHVGAKSTTSLTTFSMACNT